MKGAKKVEENICTAQPAGQNENINGYALRMQSLLGQKKYRKSNWKA